MTDIGSAVSIQPIDPKKEIDLLWTISRSLVSNAYLKEILSLIVTMTAEVMGSKICSLMLLDEGRQELSIAATQALSPDYVNKPNIRVGESVSGRAVVEKRPIAVLDVTTEKGYGYPEIARREGVVSLLSIPMIVGDRVVGVINCYTNTRHEFSENERKVLQAVANQAAIAIENTQLRQENIETKQALERQTVIERAKIILMERDGLREKESYELLVKIGQDQQMPVMDVANAVILVEELRQKKHAPMSPRGGDMPPDR